MTNEGKKYFDNNCKRLWDVFSYAMPIENAEKIVCALEEERLKIKKGFMYMEHNSEENVFKIRCNTSKNGLQTIASRYVINTTGSGLNIDKINNTLIKNLYRKGIISSNPHGGIDVDFITGKVKTANGKVNNDIYVVGPLTRGTHFYTNSLVENAKAAKRAIHDLIYSVKPSAVFITAAPVGAKPKYLNPCLPRFFPKEYLELFYNDTSKKKIIKTLNISGWKEIKGGGMSIIFKNTGRITFSELSKLPSIDRAKAEKWLKLHNWTKTIDGWQEPDIHRNNKLVLSKRDFNEISDVVLKRKLVLELTNQGWQFDKSGSLYWPHDEGRSYIEPQYLSQIKNGNKNFIDTLKGVGWQEVGSGYCRPGYGTTPYLPIQIHDIIHQSYDAAIEGASIVHLHTRDLSKNSYKIPGTQIIDNNLTQFNDIKVGDYDIIIPHLLNKNEDLILNVSTSVRGMRADSTNPKRRAHLKEYGIRGICPDIASFSPGDVIFANGGGYENSPDFIAEQTKVMKKLGIRPEIEVFNKTILNNCIKTYKNVILSLGTPPLFMLVSGVDQYLQWYGSDDDSLIPIKERKKIFNLLNSGRVSDRNLAIKLTVSHLKPIVNTLRMSYHNAKISVLMAGIMQNIIVDVAVGLKIEGIRIGLEDSLNIADDMIPGNIRKATSTADQVCRIKKELGERNISLLSAGKVRDMLSMPRKEPVFFMKTIESLKHFSEKLSCHFVTPNASKTISHLHNLMANYKLLEAQFLESVLSHIDVHLDEPKKLAELIWDIARQYGLSIRFFIEEADRYENPSDFPTQHIHTLQPLNFIRELISERHMSCERFDTALLSVCKDAKNFNPIVPKSQFKGLEIRFLEYIFGISSRYNVDFTDVVCTEIREKKYYSAVMAIISAALTERMLKLREYSNAEPKKQNVVWYELIRDKNDKKLFCDMRTNALHSFVKAGGWVCLPSTPTTNYKTGISLLKGLIAIMGAFLTESLSRYSSEPPNVKIAGVTHTGIGEKGEEIIEYSMLTTRFMNNIDEKGALSNYSSQIIYDQVILPRIIKKPKDLLYRSDGLVQRDENGWPLNKQYQKSKCITSEEINDLELIKFIGHSSGITTMQLMDNSFRKDMNLFGFNIKEQKAIFEKSLLIHFGSASNFKEELMGTFVIDITAGNDIRSIAGTTTGDYINITSDKKRKLMSNRNCKISNDDAQPYVISDSLGNDRAIRYRNIILSLDMARLHDGHTIKRYTEEAPEHLKAIISLIVKRKYLGPTQHLIDKAKRMVINSSSTHSLKE